jgi:uncharacterized protein VirK/YbjX
MTRFPNYLRLISNLSEATPQAVQYDGWQEPWLRFKFLARALAYGVWVDPWLQFLKKPAMKEVVKANPRVFLKIQWRYLNASYDPATRLEVLQSHYRFLLKLPAQQRSKLLFQPFCPLARLELGALGVVSLRLSHLNKYMQEGEMVLDLYHEDTKRFCALFFFSITAEKAGQAELSIGCLQGNKPVEATSQLSNKDLITAVTRELHGLRPKNLLLFAVRRIAARWSITKLRAVSTEMQLWKENVQADYNTFWEEVGGVRAPDGMYDLPLANGVKDPQEIKPKKRAMYRRRYQLLDALGDEIDANLEDLERTPEVLNLSQLQLTHSSEAEA